MPLSRRQQHIFAHILNDYSIRIATYEGQSCARRMVAVPYLILT
jgi:hypothetical protein